MNRNQLIRKYKGKTVCFKNLPLHSKMALILYLTQDGVWPELEDVPENRTYSDSFKLARFIENNIKFYDKKYGNIKFGILNIPMDDFKFIMFKDGFTNGLTVKEAKQHIKRNKEEFQLHKQFDYPAILSDIKNLRNGILQDGYHRFCFYVSKELKNMPIIYCKKPLTNL